MSWRDPKTDLPPINTLVIVYSERKGVHVDFVTTADKFTKDSKITDWQPMPKKPRKRSSRFIEGKKKS